jgi:hypothetical protein
MKANQTGNMTHAPTVYAHVLAIDAGWLAQDQDRATKRQFARLWQLEIAQLLRS